MQKEVSSTLKARMGRGYLWINSQNNELPKAISKQQSLINIDNVLSDVELTTQFSCEECKRGDGSSKSEKNEMVNKMLGFNVASKALGGNVGAEASGDVSSLLNVQLNTDESFYYEKVFCKTWTALIEEGGECHNRNLLARKLKTMLDDRSIGDIANDIEGTYGTHYVSRIEMGAGQATLASTKSCLSSLTEDDSTNLEKSVSGKGKGDSVKASVTGSSSNSEVEKTEIVLDVKSRYSVYKVNQGDIPDFSPANCASIPNDESIETLGPISKMVAYDLTRVDKLLDEADTTWDIHEQFKSGSAPGKKQLKDHWDRNKIPIYLKCILNFFSADAETKYICYDPTAPPADLTSGGAPAIKGNNACTPSSSPPPPSHPPQEEDNGAPCFSREAESCRILDTSVSPSVAFRACFAEPAPTVAERVKMTALTGGDYVLSAGKDQAYEFTRVIVNQHKLNERRSSTLKIALADGEIELTPDHVLLVDGQWAAAHTVKVGSSLSGSKVIAISHGVAGVINPVTVSGTIVAAGTIGRPVVASAYPEWIAQYMLEQNNGYYPLPVSMANLLAHLFPATVQAYWDEVLEHAFETNQARLGSAKTNLPTALVAPIMLALDLLCSAGLVLYLLANAKLLAALVAVAAVARARRAAKL